MQTLRDFALNLIARNQNVQNNPQAKEFLSVIQNGDSARGEQIANNICNTYGIPKDKALTDAKKFFNIP